MSVVKYIKNIKAHTNTYTPYTNRYNFNNAMIYWRSNLTELYTLENSFKVEVIIYIMKFTFTVIIRNLVNILVEYLFCYYKVISGSNEAKLAQ